MRLEHLCRITMQYTGESSWHRPYRRPDGSSEHEFGFGTGDGTVTGALEGTVTWVNTPERREDGIWQPNLRGIMRETGGAELLLFFNGLSIDGDSPDRHRAVVGQVKLVTDIDNESLRWLNTVFLVGEGEIEPPILKWWIDTYVCVNDTVPYSPKIGEQPPARFRQGAPA